MTQTVELVQYTEFTNIFLLFDLVTLQIERVKSDNKTTNLQYKKAHILTLSKNLYTVESSFVLYAVPIFPAFWPFEGLAFFQRWGNKPYTKAVKHYVLR